MTGEQQDYVRRTQEGGWRIEGTRVSLDSVICSFLEGASPEEIVSQFPTLSPEQVYGAIAFYLRRRQEIDGYLAEQSARWEELKREHGDLSDPLLDRLRCAKRTAASPRKTA